MKISVDNKELFTLTETQKKVIKDDVYSDIFEDDMKRRLHYILSHKYDQCYKNLKSKWEPILKASGVKYIPADEEEFAQLVFKQPSYKDRKERDKSGE